MKAPLFRIVTRGGTQGAFKHSSHRQKAEWLNEEIQSMLPAPPKGKWHDLIKAPFRYTNAEISRRFLPPYSSAGAFFGSPVQITSVYEVAYYFMRERVGRSMSTAVHDRTLFSVNFSDPKIVDLRNHPQITKITDRHDHSHSHQIVKASPNVDSFLYPSCRDPNRGDCIVTFNINLLGFDPLSEQTLSYTYLDAESACEVSSPITKLAGLPLKVKWSDVS